MPTQHRRLDSRPVSTKQLVLESYVGAGDVFRMNDCASHKVVGSASSSTWRLQVDGAALYLIEIGPKWLEQLAI
jgi:hypothetical protein